MIVGGNASAVTLGELWVDYEVDLLTPQNESTGGSSLSALYTGTTGMTAALPLGTAPTSAFSNFPFLSLDTSTGVFTSSAKVSAEIAVYCQGTNLTNIGFASGGGSVLTSLIPAIADAAATSISRVVKVQLYPGSTIDISATATTVTSCVARFGIYELS